ncbi:DUF3231 family protein [Virgibacillus flavescens]|uniref:DUF3231 family protein n=1 Tax=Virgibacillus flavescens TaxID=1611422 RepID=UPI003D34213D
METNEHMHVEITSSEISSLWSTYQLDTMMICGIKCFLVNIDDLQIKDLLEYMLSLIEERKYEVAAILTEENYTVPQGFTEDDVYLDTPRLFTDKLYLEFILNISSFSLASFSAALALADRNDIIDFYSRSLTDTQVLHKRTKELAKEKGTYIRAPYIPKPQEVKFVHDNSFLTGWFGKRRPLLGTEISLLVYNTKRNSLGQALVTGFSQVAQSKKIRDYFERGRDISGKHVNIFTKILNENYLSNGTVLSTPEVTNSKEAPFSDKLMLFIITILISSGIGQYGLSMAGSPRHDLGVKYTRLIAEIARFSNDGAKLMIENGWLEQPPIAADRKQLAK